MNTSCLTPAGFDALPMREKAIMVARDVIEQIKLQEIITRAGVYVQVNSVAGNALTPDYSHVSAASPEGRKRLQEAHCTVCAKGAIFLAAIQKSNKMTLGEVREISMAWDNTSWETIRENPTNVGISDKITKVDRIFTRKNLDMIESAFERDTTFAVASTNEMKLACVDFGSRYRTTDARLVAICMNIIKNDGVFDPTKNKPKVSDVARKIYGRKARVDAFFNIISV